jgi:hypothetical protein
MHSANIRQQATSILTEDKDRGLCFACSVTRVRDGKSRLQLRHTNLLSAIRVDSVAPRDLVSKDPWVYYSDGQLEVQCTSD